MNPQEPSTGCVKLSYRLFQFLQKKRKINKTKKQNFNNTNITSNKGMNGFKLNYLKQNKIMGLYKIKN